jgi:hypothetical protein
LPAKQLFQATCSHSLDSARIGRNTQKRSDRHPVRKHLHDTSKSRRLALPSLDGLRLQASRLPSLFLMPDFVSTMETNPARLPPDKRRNH